MGFGRKCAAGALALLMSAGGVAAENLALVVGNTAYRSFSDVPGGGAVLGARGAFEAADFTVVQLQNATEAQMKDALERFETLHGGADRVVVVLSGHFMHAGTSTWFAPVDLASPSLANVGFDALPLEAVLAFLADKPGGAALFLAQPEQNGRIDALVDRGVGRLRAPQGVMVAQGTPGVVARALQRSFLEPGVSLADAAADSPRLKVHGFLSDLVALNDVEQGDVSPLDLVVSEAMADEAYWRAAEDMGSRAAYEAYLRRYPNGEFAAQANDRLQVIADATPKYSPEEQAERDLGLTRNDRRRVQEQLSLLGYDPRGIDGVFGRGSRAAILRWQRENGLEASGYLNPRALRRLRAQAERRAEELAEEAARKKASRDAADAAFWASTGAEGSEAGYRVYLRNFPKGLYSDVARAELQAIESRKRETARAAETEAWDIAQGQDSIEAYKAFVEAYPNGAFAEAAQTRIGELVAERDDFDARFQAEQEEERLGIGPPMRLLIEGKLAAMNLKPGRIDGKFDDRTRRAVRRYQKARGLPETGFLTRDTVVRLMSE